MTCCLPLNWVQRTDAKLSSHILHTGRRTVKLFTVRTEENLSEKHVAPLWGEGRCKIKSDFRYITSEWHLHFAASHAISFKTSCLFWAEQLNMPITADPLAFSHETARKSQHSSMISVCLTQKKLTFTEMRKSKNESPQWPQQKATLFLLKGSWKFFEYKIGQWPCQAISSMRQRKRVCGELVHRVSALKLPIQWTSLCTLRATEVTQRSSSKLGAQRHLCEELQDELMSTDTHSHTVFFPGLSCTVANNTSQ